MSGRRSKVIPYEQLSKLRSQHPGKKLVLCHGVFDVLHAGHLAYFESAKKFGDILVVTITADQFVNKGPGRPYFAGGIRADMIAALEVVDFVCINSAPTAIGLIETLRPDFYVKGPDYKNKAADVTGNIFREESMTEKVGGRMVFTDDDTHSSSELINRFFQTWTEDQARTIEAIRALGGIHYVEEVMNRLSKESLVIIGEPIVDTYVFCQPENISSKSPSISAKFLFEENYAGGSLAIANHMSDFVGSTQLLITHGGEPYFLKLLEEKIDSRVEVVSEKVNSSTPRKTRFIATDFTQRMFELTDLRHDQWVHQSPSGFCQKIESSCRANSATLIADFGHGLFEGPVLDSVSQIKSFVGVNVQTNSSNFGFNPYTKHKHVSYLSIDTKEARVAFHDRITPPLELARRLSADLRKKGASCSMTLGAGGAYYFSGKAASESFSPAFAHSVVDATGAGDAYFAITALLVKVGCAEPAIPFLGNIFAGLKAKIIGNKSAVPKSQLLKAVNSILK